MFCHFPRILAVLLFVAWGVCGCQELEKLPPHADLSTPKSAAMVYLKAVQHADGATARAVSVGTADQKKWVDAMVAMVEGMRKFDDALYARFGRITHQVHVDMHDALWALADQPVELMKDAKVTNDEEKGWIDPPRRGFTSHFQPTLYLKHDKQGWKIDLLKTYADKVPPDKLQEVSESYRQYRAIGEVFQSVARDVSAGRFHSIDEAARALAERMAPVRKSQ